MGAADEPVLGSRRAPEDAEDLGTRILRLVEREPFAVLCTQGEAQPYGSVVAVAFTADLRHAVFATSVTTRKFRLLSASAKMALVLDDRSTWADDMMQVQALTVTGRAERVGGRADHEQWSAVLVRRHPQLEAFVRAPSCALFRVDVVRYFHVERFQEVREWTPPSS
jgi:nitroimidazol reductase NimA-like FMN-containing flavoprotein (pyridoxamine 5'-phosphate oxidase superfamily)